MDEYYNRLIKEAAEINSYFLTTWHKVSPRCALIYPRWKEHVLQYIKQSVGEQSAYYTSLVAIEKECSESMPVSVFQRFLSTLKELRHLSDEAPFTPPPAARPVAAEPEPAAQIVPQAGQPLPAPERAAGPAPAAAGPEAAPAPPAQEPAEAAAPQEQTSAAAEPEEETAPAAEPAVSSAVPQQTGRARGRKETASQKPYWQLDSEARQAYGGLLAAARDLMTRADNPEKDAYEKITSLCDVTCETLKANPVLLRYLDFATADNYIYAHTANVTVLSQAIGLRLGLQQETMRLLSFGAMAHDLGMPEFEGLCSKRDYLTDSEYSQMTLHAQKSAEKLDSFPGIDPRFRARIRRIVLQVHERVDAKGYPLGLSGKEIDLPAQIIGVADVYEAMTHPRSWREAIPPHETVKQFIERSGQEFDVKILKALIQTLSPFPPSSLVELSHGEIARVIKPRDGSLTRPLVEILLDADFSQVQPRILDLYEHPVTAYIKRPVDLAELKRKNPEFAAGLEVSRWWTDWEAGSAANGAVRLVADKS